MEKIAIVGCEGKMGSLISVELQKEYSLCGVNKSNRLEDFGDLDLVVDFASHESSVKSAEYCLKNNIPCVIGSTGQTKEENERIGEISKHIKIVKKANFSKGVEILKRFIESVLMMKPDRFEIFEKHHRNKKDSPSGTALDLEEYIRKKFDGEIKITAIREGEEMGEHKVVAFVGDEKLMITHNVYSRNAFVRGVVDEIKTLLN